MSSQFSPESSTLQAADSLLGEGIPKESPSRSSNSLLEGNEAFGDGSDEHPFLADADNERDLDPAASAKERRADLDRHLETENNPEARVEACLDYAKQGEYWRNEKPRHLERFEGYVKELGPIPGLENVLKKIGGENLQQGRGHYTEIGRAVFLKRNGNEILEFDKIVDVPGKGKTDIDILSRQKNGKLRWDENKHVAEISNDEKHQSKIDKMSAAVEQGLQVEVNGKMEPISRVVFTNRGKISPAAIEYGQSKGVEVYEKRTYAKPVL